MWDMVAMAAISAASAACAANQQRYAAEMATPEGRARQEAKRKASAEFEALQSNAKRRARGAWKNTDGNNAKDGN